MDRMFKYRRSILAMALSVVSVGALAVLMTGDGRVVAQTSSCRATTANGDVQGLLRGGTCTYLGVPYAAPPTDNLRWRPPQPRAPWAPSPLIATVAPPFCAQIIPTGAALGSEDCLTLNIWTPTGVSPDRRIPVIVWLHAGAFLGASSNFAPNDGRRFAEERDAIVVTPNYRLGAFAWLAHSALTLEDINYPSSGNYGLADQRAALGWVRDNIAAFGGDPANVTLAGSSAGAISTGLHLVSPGSRGLFQRAILHSGFASARLDSADDAARQGEAFATALGCTERSSVIACLRSKSSNQVLSALPLSTLPGGFQQFAQAPGRVVWGPVVDGLEIPDQPRELYRRGLFNRMPVIIGTTRDEGWTFVDRSFPAGLDALQYDREVRTEFGMDADAVLRLYPASAFATAKDALTRVTGDVEFTCEGRRIARVMHHDGAPVYVYSFEYTVDAVNPGRAFHGLDTNLLFGNNFGAPSNHVLTPADLVVFDAMSTYWRRFAETGDPNPRGRPVQWPLYRPDPLQGVVDPFLSDRHFVFERNLGVSSYLRDSQCNFWESFYFRSVLGAVPASAR